MTSRHAAGHQPPILFQAAETRLPDRGTHVFDNDIHTLAGGQRTHAGHHVLSVMVDHIIRPNLARFLELVVCPRRGDDSGAHGLGDLHSVTADTTPGGHDQHIFTWTHTGPVDEHLIGRESGRWQGSSGIKGAALWEVKRPGRWRQGIFGVTTTAARHYPITRLKSLYRATHLNHFAGNVTPQNLRRCNAGAV